MRFDRGGEHYGKHGDTGQQKGPFARYLQDNGIVAQYTMLGSPEQNGVVERRNRTLMEMKRSMMGRSNLPEYLWGEVWTRIFHVRSHSIGETRFLFCEKNSFWKSWSRHLFYFYFKGKIK